MNEKEFEELFGNTPFEDIKKIQQYINKNYVPIQKVKDKIEELEEEKEYYYSREKIEELNDKIQVLQELLEKED